MPLVNLSSCFLSCHGKCVIAGATQTLAQLGPFEVVTSIRRPACFPVLSKYCDVSYMEENTFYSFLFPSRRFLSCGGTPRECI